MLLNVLQFSGRSLALITHAFHPDSTSLPSIGPFISRPNIVIYLNLILYLRLHDIVAACGMYHITCNLFSLPTKTGARIRLSSIVLTQPPAPLRTFLLPSRMIRNPRHIVHSLRKIEN